MLSASAISQNITKNLSNQKTASFRTNRLLNVLSTGAFSKTMSLFSSACERDAKKGPGRHFEAACSGSLLMGQDQPGCHWNRAQSLLVVFNTCSPLTTFWLRIISKMANVPHRPSIREILTQVRGHDIADDFPTMSLIVFSTQMLDITSSPGPQTQGNTPHNLSTQSGSPIFLRLPRQLITEIFKALPVLDRIRFAKCNKLLASCAVNGPLLKTHAYDFPIFPTYQRLEAFLSINYWMAAPWTSGWLGPQRYRINLDCRWCGW